MSDHEPTPPPALPSNPAEVDLVADQLFASPDGIPLRADLYLPRGLAEPTPVIVWLHGGGFRIGDRKLAPDLVRFFARHGYAMVSVDYRLSGQAPFPAAVEDVKTAVRWIRATAGLRGWDAQRIGLWGSSAGGYLAAMLATTGEDRFVGVDQPWAGESAAVQAVVDAYGPTDFLQMDAHRGAVRPADGGVETGPATAPLQSSDPDSRESLFLGAPIETIPERVREANPISYVTGREPPVLIVHGADDAVIPAHQSELFYNALARAGSEVTFCLVLGLGHAFYNRNDLDDAGPHPMWVRAAGNGRETPPHEEARPAFEIVRSFFDQHLKRIGYPL